MKCENPLHHNSPDLEENRKAKNAQTHLGETGNLEDAHPRTIPLTQGLFAVVDEQDYDSVSKFKWHAARLGRRKTPYAKRVDYSLGRKNRKQVFLHHVIAGTESLVDHKDGNPLNCQRNNLRPCSRQQNGFNRTVTKKHGGKPTIFKGVCWHKRKQKWQANICLNRIKRHLGYFTSDMEAAIAYNNAAKELFGEFASLNCVDLKAAVSPADRL